MKNKYKYKPVDEYAHAEAGTDWLQILYDPGVRDLLKSCDGSIHPLNSS
jgi:hypothetical protein